MNMSETILKSSGCASDAGRRRGFLSCALLLKKKNKQRKQKACGGDETGKRENLGRGLGAI